VSGGVAATASPPAPYEPNDEDYERRANPDAVNDEQDQGKQERCDQDAAKRG